MEIRYNLCLTFPADINQRIGDFCQILKAINPSLDYIQGENSIPHITLVSFYSDKPAEQIWAEVQNELPLMLQTAFEGILLTQRSSTDTPEKNSKCLSLLIEQQHSLKELQTRLIERLKKLEVTFKSTPTNFHCTLITLALDALTTIADDMQRLYPLSTLSTPCLAEEKSGGKVSEIFYKK